MAEEEYETIFTDGNIRLCRIDGELVYLIAGLASENGQEQTVNYGLFQSDLAKYEERGQRTAIAHFFTLVANGLIIPRHIFRGLNRPLFDDDDMEADSNKLIHSRKPGRDYRWKDDAACEVEELSIPACCVYAIIISKNLRETHKKRFPMVNGWIDRWNWVDEDKALAEAPINWAERFEEKIYTRG
jgi:hypothetical protein